ncbi:MAG: hypothetical protein WDO69_23680 [Pseudomonadota bacterium]
MNASQSTLLRALQGLGCTALLLAMFEACNGDDASPLTPPAGPATVQISRIALGQGFVGEDGASTRLACDYTIGVNVQTTNWTLFGPGKCGAALQCGQLRVSLLSGGLDGPELLTVIAAGNGVALDVRSANPPVQEDGHYAIKVELVDDSGKPYIALDGGNGSAQRDFDMMLPDAAECKSTGSGGGGGGGGSGGASGGGGGGGGATSAGAAGARAGNDSAGAAGNGDSAGAGPSAGAAGT